jgi:HSP20 family protein
MVEKEIKEKKEQAEDKAGEIQKPLLKKAEKAGEIKETTLKKDEAEEAAMSSGKQAETMINDFLSTIRSRQEDLTKVLMDYTTGIEKPLADVLETDDEIIVKTDLPGVKQNDIDVNLTEDSVEITAQFEEEYSEEKVDYIRRERNYGKTRRFIKLPAKVKVKDATANLENSILTINLPKLEQKKVKMNIK